MFHIHRFSKKIYELEFESWVKSVKQCRCLKIKVEETFYCDSDYGYSAGCYEIYQNLEEAKKQNYNANRYWDGRSDKWAVIERFRKAQQEAFQS